MRICLTRIRLVRWTALVLLGLAEVAVAALSMHALVQPAAAQFLDDRFPFIEDRRRRYPQQGPRQGYWGSLYGSEQRPQPGGSSAAPAPRRTDVPPATKIVVFGDSMADWLAYGLEEAFGETPEMGILRKHRTSSGLIRTDSYDWPTQAREMLNAEKPDFVVMMIGLGDRRGIREAIKPPPARPPAGQKQAPAQPAQTQPAQQAAAPATPVPQPAPAKPADAEAPAAPAQESAQEQDQPNIIAPESATAGTVVHEFRSEKWGELYAKRVDE